MTNEARSSLVAATVEKYAKFVDDSDRRAVVRVACEAVAEDIIDALLASAPSAPQPTEVMDAKRIITEALSVYEFHHEFDWALRILIGEPPTPSASQEEPSTPQEEPTCLQYSSGDIVGDGITASGLSGVHSPTPSASIAHDTTASGTTSATGPDQCWRCDQIRQIAADGTLSDWNARRVMAWMAVQKRVNYNLPAPSASQEEPTQANSTPIAAREHSNTCDLVGFRQGYNAPAICSCGAETSKKGTR